MLFLADEAAELTAVAQDAVVPPLDPAQLHNHWPLPLTAEAVPALQRLAVGGVFVGAPFAEPHWPLTDVH